MRSGCNSNSNLIPEGKGLVSEEIVLTKAAAIPNHWPDKEPEPNSYRCPHCGAWRAPLGMSGQRATIPQLGQAEYVISFCGVCRSILQIQILDLERTIDTTGRLPAGFPPGYQRRPRQNG